jgi:hypothetical protein
MPIHDVLGFQERLDDRLARRSTPQDGDVHLLLTPATPVYRGEAPPTRRVVKKTDKLFHQIVFDPARELQRNHTFSDRRGAKVPPEAVVQRYDSSPTFHVRLLPRKGERRKSGAR